MEYVELKDQIAAGEQQIQALKAALQAKQQEALSNFVDGIKSNAETLGFSLSDIIDRLKPAKTKKSNVGKSAAVYVNPDNPDQTYTKGPKPGWLKERMASFGIDPADKQALGLLKDIERAPVQVSEAA